MPSSSRATISSGESVDFIGNVKLASKFNEQLHHDALLLWLIESPETCNVPFFVFLPRLG